MAKESGGLGQNSSTCTRGFGGGTSYCPGRVFAERQILGNLACLFGGFEVGVKGELKLPATAEFETVAKTKPRAVITLKRREGVSF